MNLEVKKLKRERMMIQLFDLFEDFSFKKVLVIVSCIVIGSFLVGLVFGGFYTVKEQEQAVITMFGKVLRVNGAGLYFKIPYLQSKQIVDLTTKGMAIGYSISGKNNPPIPDESVMITKDFNLVNIDFYMEYRISDPVKYLYSSQRPEQILRNMTLACVRNTVVNYNVDEVITTAKSQIQAEVKDKLSEMLSKCEIGLQVVNLSVQDAEPPTEEIQRAFKAVETAKQGKETEINLAKKYNSEQIPIAEAQVDQILQNAEAVKEARIAEANGQVERFLKMFKQYSLFPEVTRKRMYYEAMEEILPKIKLFVTDSSTSTLLPLEKFSK